VLGLVQVLVQRVRRVDGLKLLGGVLAGILEDDFLATGMLWEVASMLALSHQERNKTVLSICVWETAVFVPGRKSVTSYALPYR
jgi:hypothetical protein